MRQYLIVFCFNLIFLTIYAQDVEKKDHELVHNIYKNAVGENSLVYTGLQYVNYDDNIIGHQYFKTENAKTGKLVFDGVTYTNIPILYDIHLDEVVVFHDSTLLKSILLKEKLHEFTIETDRFINLDDANGIKTGNGIYNLLFDGKNKVFVKKKKIIEDRIEDRVYTRKFKSIDLYFIRINGEYHQITNKRSLLNLFGEHKKDVKQYLKQQKIKYKKSKDAAIVSAVFYFETL